MTRATWDWHDAPASACGRRPVEGVPPPAPEVVVLPVVVAPPGGRVLTARQVAAVEELYAAADNAWRHLAGKDRARLLAFIQAWKADT